jgi:hypothetical protein
VLVYTEGISVVWCIFVFEQEDIVANYCQQFSLDECDGKAYVVALLDATFLDASATNRQSAPKPPVTLPELRAIIHNPALSASLWRGIVRFFWLNLPIQRGFKPCVFHPPTV